MVPAVSPFSATSWIAELAGLPTLYITRLELLVAT